MLLGAVKWFNNEKGFGVVEAPIASEYFLHINNFRIRPSNIAIGTPILFENEFDRKSNRSTAIRCRLIERADDWQHIINLLGKPSLVTVEKQVSGVVGGKSYSKKEINSIDVMETAALLLFKVSSEVELIGAITSYFDESLEDKDFIEYCDFIERKASKAFDSEKAARLLEAVFRHFQKNLNEFLLFHVWKNKKFRYLSYTADEYEIPETILQLYLEEIELAELKRIKRFEYGTSFCKSFITNKIKELNDCSIQDIKNFYPLLEILNEQDRGLIKSQIDDLYSERVIEETIQEANKLGEIKGSDDFETYNRLKNNVPILESKEKTLRLYDELDRVIIAKTSDAFKPELWMKGIISDISFDLILETFCDKSTQNDKHLVMLSKLPIEQQSELLHYYSHENGWMVTFAILENFIRKENALVNSFILSTHLFEQEFWKGKKHKELALAVSQLANDNATDLEKFELFFKGYIKYIHTSIIQQNIEKLDKEKCITLFDAHSNNIDFILSILLEKLYEKSSADIDWVCTLGKQYLDIKRFNQLDKKLFEVAEPALYFKLWKDKKVKIFPKAYVDTFLQDDYANYNEIEKWIQDGLITRSEIEDFLFSNLQRQVNITDRIIFYRQLNHAKYLLKGNEQFIEKVRRLKNDFYTLILWFFDKEQDFDFTLLKQKFIYFAPIEQVRIIKKLFFLKANHELDFSIEDLNEFTRIDIDLYNISSQFNPDISLDISTDVIIQALLSYKKEKKFLVERELFSIVLKDLGKDKTRRFKLAEYFEDCEGREVPEYNWSCNGNISKINFGDNKFYFAISFSKNENESATYDFEILVEAVKKLSGSKWNKKIKHWGVPAQYEKDVIDFAKEYRFFLNLDGSNYKNNPHLANFSRTEVPKGISFCEGRQANKLDDTFEQVFWWCSGRPCYQNCETIHPSEEWEKYTLLDFCEILGFDTDSKNRVRDHIVKGHYYEFIGLINRFNRLLERAYCNECHHILYPTEISHFAAYAVVRFHCQNQACKYKEEVYLNHCLNGQCNGIIDSRVSQKCPNGLIICDGCGSCCSHAMLSRRLKNLEIVGGYIHPNLIYCVKEKLGHLERAEYFCYKCKALMDEVESDVFKCTKCLVTYDTKKYGHKRPHRYLSKPNRATSVLEVDEDLPF